MVATQQLMADLDHLDVRATIRDHIFGCFIEESSGLRSLDIIGEDNVMLAGLSPETQYKIQRGNAEKLYRFTPVAPSV